MNQEIKNPLEILGLELDTKHTDKLELSDKVQRTLSIACGLNGTQLVPLRVDNDGQVITRGFARDKAVCVSGGVGINAEKDLGAVYDYLEIMSKGSAGYLEIGLSTGSYYCRCMPDMGTGDGQSNSAGVVSFHIWGRVQFFKYISVFAGATPTVYYAAYKLPSR